MQVLALFAGQPYDTELQDLGNLDAHLTNTCRLGEGEVEEEQAVRLLSELPLVSEHQCMCPRLYENLHPHPHPLTLLTPCHFLPSPASEKHRRFCPLHAPPPCPACPLPNNPHTDVLGCTYNTFELQSCIHRTCESSCRVAHIRPLSCRVTQVT